MDHRLRPAGWTSLVEHLLQQGYAGDTLLQAGLACRTRRNTLVDRFRDRITFAIRNPQGELVGFTARCGPSAPAAVPKYLNTPTTALYRKGEAPSGLAEQQDRIRAGAVPVLVEGPFDAIAVQLGRQQHEDDFAGIALCGTAMSASLATRLAQLNNQRVVLAFDSDDAGTLATERAACSLAPEFQEVLAIGPDGEGDPAEVFSRSGAHGFADGVPARVEDLEAQAVVPDRGRCRTAVLIDCGDHGQVLGRQQIENSVL